MCGRFTVSYTYEELLGYLGSEYGIKEIKGDVVLPRYNVAPGNEIISIISDGRKYRSGLFKWGFIPSYASSINEGFKMINARSEGIEKKTSFKDSFLNKRCIILADSFYEWKQVGKDKVPFRIKLKEKNIFGFAGIWNTFIDENGIKTYSTTIITTHANDLLKEIHDRMPVILNEKEAKEWLNPSLKDKDVLLSYLKEYNPSEMEMYEVSKLVNKAINDTFDCIKEITRETLF
jgi:putative SOS response-associated peptidase YedK